MPIGLKYPSNIHLPFFYEYKHNNLVFKYHLKYTFENIAIG